MFERIILRSHRSSMNTETPYDWLMFLVEVSLTSGVAVIQKEQIKIKPGANVFFHLMSGTTVSTGAGTTTSSLAVTAGDTIISHATIAPSGALPAVDVPDATGNDTCLAMLLIQAKDIG